MNIFITPQGNFQLTRYPPRKNERLQAWNAADEYLLTYFSEVTDKNIKLRILIVNDSFGALAVALAKHNLTVWTDSWLSQQGTYKNLENNQVSNNIDIINSVQEPSGIYDYVLIKIPKSNALLEDQLYRIRPHINKDTKIISAAMVKNIHNSTLKLFSNIIGPTKTSLAQKKARLIFSEADENIKPGTSPYPGAYILENTAYKIINHANVFSRESLDIGTRFFLQHLPQDEKYKTIIDLGCGNGVVGLIAAEKNPKAKLLFFDESYMAIESAKENFHRAFLSGREAEFKVNDSLSDVQPDSVDLILNNPPFHQQHAIGSDVAWDMFKQSENVLKQQGELWVVGNRHLGYHVKLKKLFGNCKMVASNEKFVILMSVKI